jgi:acyl-CoA synthetase (AMP-forming)/AMP-acid ligase II
VAFAVTDGLSGFPASLIGRPAADVETRVEDGSLRIRSSRTALRYLDGEGVNHGKTLKDPAGFVDTGDMVEQRGDRYFFVGRRDGVINVGGQKVHPEEVEAVINAHPAVRMSLVRSRKSPITGAVVAADVVARSRPDDADALRQDIIATCHRALAAHKVPAIIRFVSSLDVAPTGKLSRS